MVNGTSWRNQWKKTSLWIQKWKIQRLRKPLSLNFQRNIGSQIWHSEIWISSHWLSLHWWIKHVSISSDAQLEKEDHSKHLTVEMVTMILTIHFHLQAYKGNDNIIPNMLTRPPSPHSQIIPIIEMIIPHHLLPRLHQTTLKIPFCST